MIEQPFLQINAKQLCCKKCGRKEKAYFKVTLLFIPVAKNSKSILMSQQPFQKFINPKNNAAIKENYKQEKKKAKKERAAAIEKHFEEKRAARTRGFEKKAAPEKKVDKRQKYPRSKTEIPAKSSFTTPAEKKNSSLQEMPLNKFIAHCGITSRRDAVQLITDGKVTVNKKVVTQPAFKVNEKDDVFYNGKKLFITKNLVYILLNKPKDYITTTDDPQNRKTVLQLTKSATDQRIYPVGRLDRNTSGVLLLTNDGDLTQTLTHPSFNIKKVYEVKLDKPLTKADFDKILNGIKLEDGEIFADALAYADAKDKSIVGIELHSGRNRIVRRIFEHLGYDVKGLDRVMYANLTKKNVERGRWRYLSEKEIRLLKYMNKQKNISGTGNNKTLKKEHKK
jgi:23S rRNA pseudouridine2605 synthase